LEGATKLYAGNHALTDPLISPVYGNFKDFPPTYLVSGTRDMFLSNTVRVHRKLRTAGVEADLNVYESFSHGDYLKVIDSLESQQVYAELKAFLLKRLETSPPVPQKKASLEDTDAINLRLTVASQFMASNSI
jgi:monoterpene epsilon-lactone hydrolase